MRDSPTQIVEPLISILVAVRNGAATLQRCIDSIAAQRFTNFELIIQDGASTDGSAEILHLNAHRIAYWQSKPDLGLYDALNRALRRARGEWIYIIGCDDYLWSPDALSQMESVLRAAYPPYRVVYGRAAFVSARGDLLHYLGEPWDVFRRRFMQGHMIPHQAVFHHRSLFHERGNFNASFWAAGDYELLLRELRFNPARFVPDVVVAAYQFGGESSVPGNALRVLRAIRAAQRMNGIGFPGLLWYGWLMRACIRLVIWTILGPNRAKMVLDRGRRLIGRDAFWTRI